MSEYHDNFQTVQAIAGERLGRAHQRSLFSRIDWFEKLHQYCFLDKESVTLQVSHEGSHAWLMLMKNAQGKFSAYANWYNFVFEPIFYGARDEITKLALLRKMSESLKSQAHYIELSPLPGEDDRTSLIMRAFRQSGWLVYRSKVDDNHILRLKGRSFDSYWQDRPGQLRSTVKRKTKKNVVAIRIETQFEEEWWHDYLTVYERSWKPEEGNPDFLKALARQESDAGCLRLGLAYIDGEPVAAQFWTVENGEALIHKLAHDERALQYSPGTLLSAALFQHVIDIDHVELVDFGTGNDAYKRDWMDDVRTRYRLELFRPDHPRTWPGIAKHMVSGLVGRSRSD